MRHLFFIAFIMIITSGCAGLRSNPMDTSQLFIEENQWEMISFQGKSIEEAGFVQTKPFIVINKEKGAIGGNSGCNSYGGNVKMIEKSLEIGAIMSTKMYCDGVPESEFFRLLEGKLSYSIEGNNLKLSKAGEVIMEFQLRK